jgi:L,D-transpeptidase YcbB
MKHTYLVITLLALSLHLFAQPYLKPTNVLIPEKLSHPKLVERFYRMKNNSMMWYGNDRSLQLRERLLLILDQAKYVGLNKRNYHHKWIAESFLLNLCDSADIRKNDEVYTDALISYCKDLHQGYDIDKWISYDEISPKCEEENISYLLVGLSSVTSPNELEWFLNFLEPVDKDYLALKKQLRMALDSVQVDNINKLNQSINLVRWIKHFNFEEYVVINPASAVLRYYVADTVNLRMKTVVGRPETPTPRFSCYSTDVVLYPYWHVPFSIAVNEILPGVKKSITYLARRNLQVIDSKGKIMDPSIIDWSRLNAKNFPYQFRQSTGCDNALGVIKFNLTNPYSVYMHDTNNKTAFLAGARYFSHGCIRLEKPVEMAQAFLPGKINSEFLESCEKDQKPVSIKLSSPVPVFVAYMTAEFDDDGTVRFLKDVYHLLK